MKIVYTDRCILSRFWVSALAVTITRWNAVNTVGGGSTRVWPQLNGSCTYLMLPVVRSIKQCCDPSVRPSVCLSVCLPLAWWWRHAHVAGSETSDRCTHATALSVDDLFSPLSRSRLPASAWTRQILVGLICCYLRSRDNQDGGTAVDPGLHQGRFLHLHFGGNNGGRVSMYCRGGNLWRPGASHGKNCVGGMFKYEA